MKSIHTLIPDIYSQLEKRGGWFSAEMAAEFGSEAARRLQEQFTDKERRGLRLSGLGPKCPCQLWYSINKPELASPVEPWAINKFCYGHIIEAWAIALAKAAGHTVEGEQDALTVDGINGHRDCVIDGCLVDVKSASSRSFLKFKRKENPLDPESFICNDDFGYLDQLDGYLVGSHDDPLVIDKEHGYLFAIDKQLGHMCLYEHRIREREIRERIQSYRGLVGRFSPPECTCVTVADGKSGNIKLGVKASYSSFKHLCFPNLRTFLYANGPVFLTKVVRKPDVTEIDKNGKIMYN